MYSYFSRIILFLCCFLLLPLYIFATPVLQLLGQPDDVAEKGLRLVFMEELMGRARNHDVFGVIAGIAMAEMIFGEVDPTLKVEWSRKDGGGVQKRLQFGKVHGRAHNIVVAERVVFKFMQRMSGIATLTKAMADAARPAYILETRKNSSRLTSSGQVGGTNRWRAESQTGFI